MWLLLAIVALFCQSIFWLIVRTILKEKEYSSIAFTIYFDLFIGIILLGFALFNGFSIPPLNHIWLNLIGMIILYAVIDIFQYLSLRYTPISEFIIIRATVPIWTALISIPILHESTNPTKIMGIILSVVGVLVIFYKNKKFHLHQGHLFVFISAVLYGFAFTNDAILLHHFNSVTYSSLFFLLPPFLIATVYPNKLLKINFFLKRNTLIKFFFAAIPLAIWSLAVNTSYRLGGEISQISTITQLSTILTIILGIFLLKEKENIGRKVIGGIIIITVIILIQLK